MGVFRFSFFGSKSLSCDQTGERERQSALTRIARLDATKRDGHTLTWRNAIATKWAIILH